MNDTAMLHSARVAVRQCLSIQPRGSRVSCDRSSLFGSGGSIGASSLRNGSRNDVYGVPMLPSPWADGRQILQDGNLMI